MARKQIRLAVRLSFLAVIAGIAFFPVVASAIDPGPKCESAKLKSSAKQAKCRAGVFAKSIKKVEAPDVAKLAKCDDKFAGGFTKAEDKGGVDCPTTGDAGAIEGVLDTCIDDVVSDLGGAPGAGGDAAKCQSKKAKEAGKYAQCRLKADSKGVKKGEAPDYTKCDTKLSDKWAKIESKPPCLTNGDLATVKADVDACQAAVISALSGNCGNGAVDAGEQCDDGNTSGGDGCDALCQNECGNGSLEGAEECDDGNLVNGDGCDDMCMNEPVCGNGSLEGAEECDDGNLVNGDGCDDMCMNEVVGVVEYQQDFEALNQMSGSALGDDGWLVGANVFAGLPPGGAFLYNYFAFPAPNGGPAFSAIATGEGDVPQGAQQMSVYSDYNNGDHLNGNTIEANVFQQIAIGVGDVGKVFTFQFDHKLGNLNSPADPECPSTIPAFLGTPCANTAQAFIKVFDPVFTLLDFPTADMTSISATWGTSSVSTAPIPVGAVGGVLQFGFLNKASLYQPSGIFYDNIVLSSTGGAPPAVCGDGAVEGSEQCDDGNLINGDGCDDMCNLEAVPGEYAINGDFETGDKTGWTEFLNNGSFTVSGVNTNGGSWSGNLVASVPGGGGPPSFPVIKQANIGVGSVVPNGTVTVQFDLNGSLAGAGGVVFAEMFSEISGGGTSKSEIITGAPLFPVGPNDWTAGWVSYSFNLTLGPDVSGGVTLQLKTDCGANPGCTVDLFIDNVSVTVP